MPIYEYRCSACGHDLEVLQKLSDAPLTLCPACGKSDLRKQVSAAGFQLKGSGWYVTDFRNNGATATGKDKSAGADAKGNGAGDTATETAKSDTKTADKSGATASATESKNSTESKTSTAPASKSEA